MSANATPVGRQPVRRGFDAHRVGRLARRFTLPLAVAAIAFFWLFFGAIKVPHGMDTMPHIPPESVCLVDKRTSHVRVGQEVFVEVPGGGTVLSRVVEITPDGAVVVRHDAESSRLPDSRAFGPVPLGAVQAIVICVFSSKADAKELPREAGSGR